MLEKSLFCERVLISLFIISIIPILIMAFYAGPLRDDFNSTVLFHSLWIEKKYVLAFLSLFTWVGAMYFSWQGTYFAELLFELQPGAWSISAYWLTTFFIVGAISFSYIFLGSTVLEKVFDSKKIYGRIIALLILIVQFQGVPFIHQGFYWYNGAIYYSFIGALFLIEISFVIRMLYTPETITKRKRVLLALFAFCISGGNYSTALVNCLLLFLITVCSYFYLDRAKFKVMRIICIVAMTGLIISMIAPGNAARSAQTASSMPAIPAVYNAIVYALKSFLQWFRLRQLSLVLFMIPVIYRIVETTKVKFRFPLLALVIMFGLYAAQIVPPYYGLSSPGAERQIDMYYYSFHLLITGCLIYVEGWLVSRLNHLKGISDKILRLFCIAGVLVLVIWITSGNWKNLNSYKIADDLISGRAAQYAKEYREITDKMSSEQEVCYVKDIKQWTYSLDVFDIQEDPKYWTNVSLAQYYGCKQVILIKE